ncbi:MFS transporter [Halotalea alkalilenta]|uniref:MFS transporter n=1 Tax=Halotalea alkalilenta TaxID=376489 RepID=UPI00069363B2|nr:MFS transporter [Halotalea alkalilenta]
MTTKQSSSSGKQFLGLPIILMWGYLAIAIFMTGDGIEQAFLSSYLIEIGFSQGDAAMVFTVYGLIVAIASWFSGVFAEMIGPRNAMKWGAVIWLAFHVLFMIFGIEQENLAMITLLYGIRGIGYPLFIYSFIVWIAQVAPSHRLASAMGWFWAMYSVGVGFIGTYLPSFTIPVLGFAGTLWMATAWVAVAGFMGLFLIKDKTSSTKRASASRQEKIRELARGVTILAENRNIAIACVVRSINQLALFGFVVFMPVFFTHQLGFSMSEWLRIWGAVFITTIFTNVLWGVVGDKIGWLRLVRWFGAVGCAISCLAFYYLPLYFGHNFGIALIAAIVLGTSIAAFVPMSALFPSLAPEHKGAAISAHNLAAGLSNFFGPAIALMVLPYGGPAGVIWTYTVLYLIAAVLTCYIELDEGELKRSSRAALAAEREAQRDRKPGRTPAYASSKS